MEVEFITIGMASEHLKMNAATLRKWADYLEEINTHYIHRNDRDERVFNRDDIKIFEFMNNYKKEFGMKTQLRDLANMLEVKAEEDEEFQLRKREDVPELDRKQDTDILKILNQDDIKNLMDSERTKQFTQIIMQNISTDIQNKIIELKEELKEEVREEMEQQLAEQKQFIEESHQRIEERLAERDEKTVKRLNQAMEQKNQSIWSKLFGGKKSEPIE